MLLLWPQAGASQEVGVTITPIVTIDTDLVFGNSTVGQQIATRLEAQVLALASENEKIAAQLQAEEMALTERRASMDPEAFRALADAFDQKVQRIRDEQDAKQRDLQALRDEERAAFLESITPILSGVAREHGAVAVLERRNVLLSADSIDITQLVIERIEAALAADAAAKSEAENAADGHEATGETGGDGNTPGDQ